MFQGIKLKYNRITPNSLWVISNDGISILTLGNFLARARTLLYKALFSSSSHLKYIINCLNVSRTSCLRSVIILRRSEISFLTVETSNLGFAILDHSGFTNAFQHMLVKAISIMIFSKCSPEAKLQIFNWYFFILTIVEGNNIFRVDIFKLFAKLEKGMIFLVKTLINFLLICKLVAPSRPIVPL